MERRDYMLKQIEKIGVLISAIRQKISGGNDNLSITLEKQIEDAKGMLLNEMNFDFNAFLEEIDTDCSNEYIGSFAEFNIDNIELLADYISQIGFHADCDNPQKYLEKALQLYELCNLKSKVYSFEREKNIATIKNFL
ncbi:hypothetical protein D0T50_04375 [Bacteroides sp. 214]|uniref:hypothetical protein n=1 Tax=Bacteroides sp. 214 TaxID=2302935 RepID=UPI0013D03C7D|nr:hypothetical protein [Bacteroides sp. 214]NDW12125.1 hypothetical protein [Bacteroides sp. 214]